MLFEHGRNAKQVQKWLGHHSPGFTLDRYVHLMDDGVGDAEFMDLVVTVGRGGSATPTVRSHEHMHGLLVGV